MQGIVKIMLMNKLGVEGYGALIIGKDLSGISVYSVTSALLYLVWIYILIAIIQNLNKKKA